ncbi:MAG: SWIB/MDM2 domain-containing protein [Acidobacteria bacterium]|nr:SWIB/MDM2 domain-containing protein [Acidobacteriota bacterium]
MAKRKKKAKRGKKRKKRATGRRVTRRRSPAKRRKKKATRRKATTGRRPAKRRKKKKARRRGRRRPNAAFMRPMTLSPALAAVIGSKAIPRTQVTKKLWLYIKKKKLQDKKNRRMINADPLLKKVFGGRSSVNMFLMTKLVSKHLK